MFNVGINCITSETPLWYALPDVIASKILTGKAPKIIEAIRFTPKGIQEGLIPSEILGISIDPAKDNLIQVLVEERQKIKQQMKETPKTDPAYSQLSSREHAMKILVNAMSYGIFIELNKESGKTTFDVYGLTRFTPDESYFEEPGHYFHPMLGVVITAGSRMFLAMAEAKTRNWRGSRLHGHGQHLCSPGTCPDRSRVFPAPEPVPRRYPFTEDRQSGSDLLRRFFEEICPVPLYQQ